MFDKVKFAQIIKNISDAYENQRDFSKKSGINRTYLSQYMNMKLDNPPKPNILMKLSKASNGLVNYNELMKICGYTDISLDIVNLESLRDEVEKQYLNELASIHLSAKETEVYDTIIDIFPPNTENMESDEIRNMINSYFEGIDWISEKSKNKIIDKIQLFIEYCNDLNEMQNEIYLKMASHKFGHNQNDLEDYKYNSNKSKKIYMCPVYGQISAGVPNWAEECIEGRLPIDPSLMDIVDPEECFFLRVNGESMNKVVQNGSYALIRKTDWVENGEIAVVLVNGFDATLKKFSKQGDLVVLEPMSDDSSFQVQVYDKNTPIKVIGKYIGKFEMK